MCEQPNVHIDWRLKCIFEKINWDVFKNNFNVNAKKNFSRVHSLAKEEIRKKFRFQCSDETRWRK